MQPFLPWKINKYYHNQMNGTIFGEKKLLNINCYLLFCQILMKFVLPRQIFRQYTPNFKKIRVVGAQLFHVCRRTDTRINGHTDMHI